LFCGAPAARRAPRPPDNRVPTPFSPVAQPLLVKPTVPDQHTWSKNFHWEDEMKHRAGICKAALVALAIAVAPAMAAADTHDAVISTKAKIKLLTADDVSVNDVNVDTKDGRVVLHGKVASEGEKQRAEAAVRKVDGVKSVENLLQVVPKTEEKSVKASDQDIEKSVKQHLKSEGLDDVDVKSVNDGVVLLAGKAPTVKEELAAIEHARMVPGVRRVASEIKVDSEEK
jgi:hyperosmotically inducible protein